MDEISAEDEVEDTATAQDFADSFTLQPPVAPEPVSATDELLDLADSLEAEEGDEYDDAPADDSFGSLGAHGAVEGDDVTLGRRREPEDGERPVHAGVGAGRRLELGGAAAQGRVGGGRGEVDVLREQGVQARVIDTRWLSPLPKEALTEAVQAVADVLS